jgi:hypothetical protein
MGGECKATSGTHVAHLSFSRLLPSTSILVQYWCSGSGHFMSDKKSNDFWVGGQCSRSLDRSPTGKLGFSWIRGISLMVDLKLSCFDR